MREKEREEGGGESASATPLSRRGKDRSRVRACALRASSTYTASPREAARTLLNVPGGPPRDDGKFQSAARFPRSRDTVGRREEEKLDDGVEEATSTTVSDQSPGFPAVSSSPRAPDARGRRRRRR